MSSPNRPECDVCGAVKRDTNHWFLCGGDGSIFKVLAAADAKARTTRMLQDICGEACAHKALSQWMDKEGKALNKGELVSQGDDFA